MKRKRLKKHAFGVLLHRTTVEGLLEVFLVQENGPQYWEKGRTKIWGLPKGKGNPDEKSKKAAKREFEEEVGIPFPKIEIKKLMHHHRPRIRHMITVFVGNANNVDIHFVKSETQTKEYPCKSGQLITYPEVKTGQWFDVKTSLQIILPGQRKILRQFVKKFSKGKI